MKKCYASDYIIKMSYMILSDSKINYDTNYANSVKFDNIEIIICDTTTINVYRMVKKILTLSYDSIKIIGMHLFGEHNMFK